MNNNTFVVDASYILSYLFSDERNKKIDQMMHQHQKQKVRFISTTLLPYEVMNGLKSAFLRNRLKKEDVQTGCQAFLLLSIPLEIPTWSEVLTISLNKNISSYDASYVALARKNKLQLLTFDKQLKRIAKNT